MQFKGRELKPESWLRYSATKDQIRIVRADAVDPHDVQGRTHFEFISQNPNTAFYRWPTELELIQHFGAQPCKT